MYKKAAFILLTVIACVLTGGILLLKKTARK